MIREKEQQWKQMNRKEGEDLGKVGRNLRHIAQEFERENKGKERYHL